MEGDTLKAKIEKLSPDLRVKVEIYIDNLIEKKVKNRKKSPVFGSAKGQIIMSQDFDEPLEDFKEYM